MPMTVIMIPTYNCGKSTALSLESCIAQTVATDVMVVDNCSTDGTQEVVQSFVKTYPNIRLIVNEKNLGRVGNFNRCIELFRESNYDYIKFLFTGDTLKPHCIETVEKIIARYPDLGAIVWPYEFKDGEKISIPRHYNESRYLSPDEINELNIIDGGRLGAIVANVYSKKAIVESGAYFNEIFIGKADFDNRVLQHHGLFHCNTVLSTFNVEHHRTFGYALDNYRIALESAFNSACALERCRNDLPHRKYEKLKRKVVLNVFKKNIHYLSLKEVFIIPGIMVHDLWCRFVKRIKIHLGFLKNHGNTHCQKSGE